MTTAERVIELQEHEESEAIELSLEEYDRLSEALTNSSITRIPGTENEYKVNPRNAVGIVRIDNLVIDIKPKIPFERVLFLVAYALKPDYWQHQIVQLGNANSLHEAIAIPFARFAEKATRRNVLHSYRTYDDTIAGIKGRLRLDDQLRRHMRLTTPVEVSYDDLSSDTDKNRLLLAACERLLRLRRLDKETTQTLRRVVHRLPEVQKVRYTKKNLPNIQITRLNTRYENALDLAKLILSNKTIELGSRSTRSEGMLFDMANVFEDFVHAALKESLKLHDRSFPPNAKRKSLYLDQDKTLKLRPDFSWWEDDICKAVGDIKYKKSVGHEKKGKEPDIYQLLAYTTATDLDEGFLIYADTEDNPTPKSHTIKHADKSLHIETLNLQGTNQDILQRVNDLAEKIKSAKIKTQLPLELAS